MCSSLFSHSPTPPVFFGSQPGCSFSRFPIPGPRSASTPGLSRRPATNPASFGSAPPARRFARFGPASSASGKTNPGAPLSLPDTVQPRGRRDGRGRERAAHGAGRTKKTPFFLGWTGKTDLGGYFYLETDPNGDLKESNGLSGRSPMYVACTQAERTLLYLRLQRFQLVDAPKDASLSTIKR